MRHNLNRESENTDRWLVSYADFITLLFAFFVVMYSVSQVNEGKFKILSETLTDAFVQPERSLQPIQIGEVNKAETTTSGESTYPADYIGEPATPETDQSFQELRQDLSENLKQLIDANLVKIRSNQDWIEIDMGSGLLFSSGEDVLSQNATSTLETIVDTLQLKGKPLALKIRGYTDNIPIQSNRFSSNWSLSSARAVAVLYLLEQKGIEPSRMTAEGYGEHQPIADNDTDQGRKKNRRVVLAISRFAPAKSELERKAIEEAAAEEEPVSTEAVEKNTVEPEINIIRSADGTLIIRGATNTEPEKEQ